LLYFSTEFGALPAVLSHYWPHMQHRAGATPPYVV